MSPIVEGVSEIVDESFGGSKVTLARVCPGIGTTGIPVRALIRDEDEGSGTAAACADTGSGVWICAGTGICVGAETETGERTGATSVGGTRKPTPDAFESASSLLPQGPVGRVGKTGWTGAKMGISPKFPCGGVTWKNKSQLGIRSALKMSSLALYRPVWKFFNFLSETQIKLSHLHSVHHHHNTIRILWGVLKLLGDWSGLGKSSIEQMKT